MRALVLLLLVQPAGAQQRAAGGAAPRASVALFPTTPVNLGQGAAIAIDALLASSLRRVSGAQVVVGTKTLTPATVARELGAQRYVLPTAVRLEHSVLLRATLHDASGAVLKRATATTARLDNVRIALDRLAAGLFGQGPPVRIGMSRKRTRGPERKRRKRRFKESIMGVRAAFIQPVHVDAEFSAQVQVQFNGRMEAEAWFLEFGGGLTVPTGGSDRDYGALYGQIGGALYLNPGPISAYCGAGFVPRLVITSNGGIDLPPYLQLGVMMLRELSTRLYTEVQVTQTVLGVDTSSFEGRALRPTELGINLGVGW